AWLSARKRVRRYAFIISFLGGKWNCRGVFALISFLFFYVYIEKEIWHQIIVPNLSNYYINSIN
ncbi:MAG: hypothetical protein SOV77_09655, partial [Lachnospiraceae bacterium]|nr:hypothetical protein [Lachnospiraceae bacterium]